MVKKKTNFHFKALDKGYECYKSCFAWIHLLTTPRYAMCCLYVMVIKSQKYRLHVKCKCMEHHMALNLMHYGGNTHAVRAGYVL